MAFRHNLNFAPQHPIANSSSHPPPLNLPPPPMGPPTIFGIPQPNMGSPHPAFGVPPPNMGQQPLAFGVPPPNMGQGPPALSVPPPNMGPLPPGSGAPPNIGPCPFPPPSLQMAFPGHPYPMISCSASLPPPNVCFYSPATHDLPTNDFKMNMTKDPFESLKDQIMEKYKDTGVTVKKDPHIMKISSFKRSLIRCFNMFRQLEGQANCLKITYKTLSGEEWTLKRKEIENTKAELSHLMATLNTSENLKEMQKLLQKHAKKLQYRKRKRKEWQEQKREAKLNSDRENRRIDLWLEKMKDEVAREKREEDIKREADMVLSDVTTKKAEAKRMLNLLNSLSKLRAARVQNLPGASQSTTDSVVFNEVIDRLKKMWLDKIKEYNMEEQGLKVMLEHAEEERISVEAAEFRKNLTSWSRLILGPSNMGLSQSLDEFIQIRQDWDSFIRAEDTLLSSSIPIGWVIPSQPSSEEWRKFLK